MPKVSFIAKNMIPLSQNSRRRSTVRLQGARLRQAYYQKYPAGTWPADIPNLVLDDLKAKVFYLHKVPDRKDADNISKPFWDSLNKRYFDDDFQIKYLETLKVHTNDPNNWNQFDITNIDMPDLLELYDFLLNTRNPHDRMVYVEIDDYNSSSVRF